MLEIIIWIISLAPSFKKRSNWLTSSFKIAVKFPVRWFSCQSTSNDCTCEYPSKRMACSISCAILRHWIEYKYWNKDSKTHIKNVVIAIKINWDSIVLKPNCAIQLSCLLTTKSTATPIKISGAISNSLFRKE